MNKESRVARSFTISSIIYPTLYLLDMSFVHGSVRISRILIIATTQGGRDAW